MSVVVRVLGALLCGVLVLVLPGLAAASSEPPPGLAIEDWSVTDGVLEVSWSVPEDAADEVVRFISYVLVQGEVYASSEHGPQARGEPHDLTGLEDGTSFSYLLEAELTSGDYARVSFAGMKGQLPELTYEAISHSEDDLLELRWSWPPQEAEILRYEVTLMMSSVPPGQDETSVHETVDPVLLVPFPHGRSYGFFRLRVLTADGWSGTSDRLNFYYEDVLPAPTRLTVKPRSGGFQVGWGINRAAGTPDSWLVTVDGEPVDVKVKRYNYGHKALVLGLPNDSVHTITVQSVNQDGPGLPATATARTAAGASVMPAPTVRPGRAGGDRTVVVSWGTPDWGGGQPCCFRVTAVGRAFDGKKVTIRRFADADVRSMDFGVGSKGPWRFAIEAKTGTGFSPVSAYSGKVRAR